MRGSDRARVGHHPRSARSELSKYLAGLRGEQAAKRAVLPTQTEFDELAACKALAWELFREKGVVEFPCELDGTRQMGHLRISVFLDPKIPGRPGVMRRTQPMFQGASFAELKAQVDLWKAKR